MRIQVDSAPQWSALYEALTMATAAGNLAYLSNDEEAWRRVQATVSELIEMTKKAERNSISALGRMIQAGEDGETVETPPANPENGGQ
jgi:hypothetical protein